MRLRERVLDIEWEDLCNRRLGHAFLDSAHTYLRALDPFIDFKGENKDIVTALELITDKMCEIEDELVDEEERRF